MAKLIKAVHVRDPERHRTVLLLPGEEPEPRLAALVTNPDAWEDGELPEAAQETADDSGTGDAKDDGDDGDQPKAAPATKTAAKKTAARKPARGRDAAEVGDSGE
ncbi:hypothetical protein AB0G67_40550 [Streptomyces sp. NPDC021056]|uniref:hypothetical protein n=1 Tax=Streptomyces sp. NPDC021056 TaxID=3155012 RepID=UPI00340B53D2